MASPERGLQMTLEAPLPFCDCPQTWLGSGYTPASCGHCSRNHLS